jgi:hypothetical protein
VAVLPEGLKKYCSQLGARIFGFWRGFVEGAGLKSPVTEPTRPVRRSLGEGGSQKPKRPLFSSSSPNGYSIFLIALVCVLSGFARAENVVLYLKSGDKLTGFVIGNYTNRVVLSNSWVKELSVPLAEIERREIIAAGTNHLATTNALAKLKAQVTPAAPPALFKYWKGEAEVGLDLVYSTVNQQTYHGRFKLSYEHPYASNPKNFFRNTLDYSLQYGKTEQNVSNPTPPPNNVRQTATSADQMGASDKTSADFDRHWYAYNLAGIGYDRIRNIDLHIEEGPGLGYHLFTRTNFLMNVESGANYQIQYDTDDTATRDFFFRIAEDVAWKIDSRTTLSEKAEFFPRVDFSQYRLRAETTLSYNLWRYIYLNMTLRDSYDTRPAVGAKSNELEVHSALGVKF